MFLMFAPVFAAVLAFAFLIALGITGRLRFVADEMPSWTRRIVALALLWVVLVTCVFYPTVSAGDAADVDPATLWFPSIFIGHLVLGGFLLLWWLLAWPMPLRRFLRLEDMAADDVPFGLGVGVFGWIVAIAASAAVAGILLGLGHNPSGGEEPLAQPFEVPPLLIWLTHLSVWRKLIVVAAAMTIEEAFYRAFLQTRVGWLLSSVIFAFSHGGYGLPTLTASVFAVSLVIGWALRQRGNLLPCIVAHGVFDGVQLLVVMPIAVEHLRTLG
jgi:membrane protease YdiL (CAAX protease family)